MKKFFIALIALISFAAVFPSCEKTPEGEDVKAVATISQQELIDAFAKMYSEWEENTTIPSSLAVSGKNLTLPQYRYALCKLVANLTSGQTTGNIDVLNYKAADHPERDSYDMETIAVKGEESVATIATKMLQAMKEKGQVPNQTLFTRNGSAIAFSTNRATVTLARAIAAYKKDGKFPQEVSTDYLSAAATLKGFAQQLVTYLDVWQKTVGTVSADGSHCSDNNSAWENVHFIPIPHSGGAYADGKDQYDPKFQPYHSINVAGTEYTAAQCFIVAAKGFLDLVTKEGSALKQVERNTPLHTLANGKGLNAKIPLADDWALWGQYPWYEKSDDPCAINLSDAAPCNVGFMLRSVAWFLTRAEALGKIGNFVNYDEDPESSIVEKPYYGNISSMRMFIILCRFYKHILDNNISENIYDAVKDVNFDYDFYGVETPDIELQTKSLNVTAEGQKSEAQFVAKKAWQASTTDSWLTVSPSSGDAASPVKIEITAAANTGEAREGKVLIKGGNVTDPLAIIVKQDAYVAPTEATIKDFAVEFVKCLQVWQETVGKVDACSIHCTEKGNAFQNVHFIPIGETQGNPYGTDGNQYDPKYTVWTMNVKGVEYSSAQAWEIAIRALLDMVTSEGSAGLDQMTDRNKPFTLADNAAMSAALPSPTAGCRWGTFPWYEGDDSGNRLVTYNGADISEVDIVFMVKVCSWHVVRSFIKVGSNTPLGAIGNFQQFGTDPSTLILDGYNGQISPMRELVIVARIYKYLLDNNVNDKVYTAIKDQKFDFDMYHQDR